MERSMSAGDMQQSSEELREQKIQENIANWQSGDNPLTSLSEEQLDIIYQVKDLIEESYYSSGKTSGFNSSSKKPLEDDSHFDMPIISTNQDYIKWMVKAENEMKSENLSEYMVFYNKLQEQSGECELLFKNTEATINAVEDLHKKYELVTAKTDSLHNLSEQLMKHQKQLKDKRACLKERLHYFRSFRTLSNNIDSFENNVGNNTFMETLDKVDECLNYLNDHPNFKETKVYTAKFENLLSKAVILIRRYFNDVVSNATKQVTDPYNKANLLTSGDSSPANEVVRGESAFSLYYGKFQNAAVKVKPIISHIEDKIDKHDSYKQLIFDCQQTYFAQRSVVMTDAVAKALMELKNKHKNDHSVLFRSAGLFIMQVCLDEAACFNYFFTEHSQQLNEYFGILCQNLYDMLRPCLIGIYHLEVLTELCGILKGEMLNEQIQSNETLDKFTEIIRQLLEDVEERLVFRTNIFFQNDLVAYQPSPGDLAYPEKLEQMENIAEEIIENRTESRASIASLESQEVANINTTHLGQFRSYTGNSPADLHGMWYPTVKRTLVCLSRLYFCLDREIFQGLAQEALSICVETIAKAATLISSKKTTLDGRLFQIKHLLILREQIAPFQVDFTIKEVSLDFSNIKAAAVGLYQNRNKLFTFSSNNALLEFLLEGTPRVKEYLVDSRKEIDKQLKAACEVFISHATSLLVGNLLQWIQKAENSMKVLKTHQANTVPLREQEFAKPQMLARHISTAQRNIKSKIPEIQRSMQLYLANRETEFILFRPIKNNIINAFLQVEQILEAAKYTSEDQVMIACPTPEQINFLICSVSLTSEQDHFGRSSSRTSSISAMHTRKESTSSQPSIEQPSKSAAEGTN